MLHALAACLTAGLAKSPLRAASTSPRSSSTVEGDIDLLGILGLSDEVRNGYQQIKISFQLRGDDPDKLRQVVEQSRRRSAVFDIITNGCPSPSRSTPADRAGPAGWPDAYRQAGKPFK